MNSGIYCIRNTKDGKRYIGRTVDFTKRKRTHFWLLENNNHFNVHLQRAYNLNPNDFVFEIIEKCEKDKCNENEIYFISKYQTMDDRFGYNLCEGGHTTSGRKCSTETKKKISQKNTGRKFSKEVVNKRIASLKKRFENEPEFAKRWKENNYKQLTSIPGEKKSHPCSEENKRIVSKRFKGRKISDEHKEKLRELYSGEKSLTAKLTESEVIQMRLRFLMGEKRMEIAKDFPNLHPNTVYDIVKGKRWKHIPNEIGELKKWKN